MSSELDSFLARVRDAGLPDEEREERILAATLAAAPLAPTGEVLPPDAGPSLTAQGTAGAAKTSLLSSGIVKLALGAGIAGALAWSVLDAPWSQESTPVETPSRIRTPAEVPPVERNRWPSPSRNQRDEKFNAPLAPETVKQVPGLPDASPEGQNQQQRLPPTTNPQRSPTPSVVAGEDQGEPKASVNRSGDPSGAIPVPAPSLAQELENLQRIQSALRQGQPQKALRLIEQSGGLQGPLLEEREAALVMAQCMSQGGERSRSAAEKFLKRSPGSINRDAIEQICKIE